MTQRLPLILDGANLVAEATEAAALLVPGRAARPNKITATVTVDENDVTRTGLGKSSRIIVYSATGGFTWTGLEAGELGDEVTIEYRFDSGGVHTLTARDPLSATANWFVLAHHVVLKPYQSISFRYGDSSANPGWFPIDDRFGTAAALDVEDLPSHVGGGLTIQVGPNDGTPGPVLGTQVIFFQAPANYSLSDWQLYVEPAATVSIDVRTSAFPTKPVGGDSMTDGHPITTTAVTSNTGDMALWDNTTINRGDWVAIAITANDLAQFISVQLQGSH